MSLEKTGFEEYHKGIFGALKKSDGQVYELIAKEYERVQNTLQLIAAENRCSRAVLAALGSVVQNKTAEGFAGARYHGGCEVVDQIERLAQSRAKEAFGAQYANMQPHSGSQANQIIFTAMMERGDKVLSLGTEHGGHTSHGSRDSFSGRLFDVDNYYVDRTSFLLDYERIRQQALKNRPKLIMCGASAYVREIDFKRFREIADEAGAYLLADISHISGLVIAGAHQSPVDYAHFTTTSTYKAAGPRGGLILMGKDKDLRAKAFGRELPLWKHIEEATFPGVQGTPYFNHIAAKAVFFKESLSSEYKARQFKIIENAKKLASCLMNLGFDVLTGGTDNHMILVNVINFREGLTGVISQKCLEECGVVVDRYKLPYDQRDASVTSGIRLGTPIVTRNGMGDKEMDEISVMIDSILKNVEIISDSEYEISKTFKEESSSHVKHLCGRFVIC